MYHSNTLRLFLFSFVLLRVWKSVQNFELKGLTVDPLFPVMKMLKKESLPKYGKPARKFH